MGPISVEQLCHMDPARLLHFIPVRQALLSLLFRNILDVHQAQLNFLIGTIVFGNNTKLGMYF